MKKILFSFVAVLALAVNVHAQSFDEDFKVWTFGYGIGAWIDPVLNTLENEERYTDFKTSNVGPFYAKFEYGVTDEIGIGINLAYVSRETNFTEVFDNGNGGNVYNYHNVSYNSFSFLLRLNKHFSDNDKIDVYWGTGLGYKSEDIAETETNASGYKHEKFSNPIPLGLDCTIGVRFYITPTLGIYIETGMAKSVMQFGLSGRF